MSIQTLLVSGIVLCAVSLQAEPFTLVKDGIPQCAIVRSENASKEFMKNVRFFNQELSLCTKTALPVVEAPLKGKNNIVFAIEKRPLETEDAFTIDFPSEHIMKITGTERSVRWAFNRILRHDLGIRWLFPPLKGFYGSEINHYPKRKNVSVERKKFSDMSSIPLSRMTDWHISFFVENWNEKLSLLGVHLTVIDVFPVYKYAVAGSWPEAIMPVIKGKKVVLPKAKAPLSKNIHIAMRGYNSNWQLCWSNPETTRLAIENILEILAKNPDKNSIDMDVNDMGGYCECPACRKAVGTKRTQTRHANYSEIYWKWVDTVAREVSKKYPHMIFRGIAYREVLDPPSFKLHKNVLVRLAIELPVLLDPEIGPKRWKLIADWKAKAARLDLYDYEHGIDFFLLPRIYFKSHSALVKTLVKKYGLRSAYFESNGQTPFQGPQQYLLAKLMWDIDADPEAVVKEWCVDAVGAKAAPYLLRYYDFWENYWTGPEIRKTQWYKGSVGNVYLQLGEKPTHLFALKKGDMAKLRALMEKVVANAETPEQKKRAAILMELFEFSEFASKAVFAEIMPPEGKITDKKKALEILDALPDALKAYEKFKSNRFLKFHTTPPKTVLDAMLSTVGKVLPYIQDKEVREKLETLSRDKAIPLHFRGTFKIWLGAKAENLIENGSIEKEKPLPPVHWNFGSGKRSSEHASDGKYSFKTHNGYYLMKPKVLPGKTYLFLIDIYTDKTSAEGKFCYQLGESIGNTPRGWVHYMNNKPNGGSWTTYSGIVTTSKTKKDPATGKGIDNLRLQLLFRNFEKGEFVYLDNIRLYCLDDIH